MVAERLRQAGIDYRAGLSRFLGDGELYETVLTAFLADAALEKAQAAFARGDRAALFQCAHEIKGSAGNADMAVLYEASCALVTLLREPSSTDAAVARSFATWEGAYAAARAGIREALEVR